MNSRPATFPPEPHAALPPPRPTRFSPRIVGFLLQCVLAVVVGVVVVLTVTDRANETGRAWVLFGTGVQTQSDPGAVQALLDTRASYAAGSAQRAMLAMVAARQELAVGDVRLAQVGKAATPQDNAADAAAKKNDPTFTPPVRSSPATLTRDTSLLSDDQAPFFNPASVLLYLAPPLGVPLLPLALYMAFHAILAGWLWLWLSRYMAGAFLLGRLGAPLVSLAVLAQAPQDVGFLPWTLALGAIVFAAIRGRKPSMPPPVRKLRIGWLLLTAPAIGLLLLSTCTTPLALTGLAMAGLLAAVVFVGDDRASRWLLWLGLAVIGVAMGSLNFAPRVAAQIAPGDVGDPIFQRSIGTAVRVGAYGLFIGGLCLLLGYVMLVWQQVFVGGEGPEPANFARRVFKNSLAPLLSQLLVKGIDLSFAFVVVRFIGVDGNGRYAIAVVTFVFFSTVADFGLETLITRDVARDRTQSNANRYLMTASAIRLGLAALTIPTSLAVIGILSAVGDFSPESGWAILLLMIGLIPSTLSGGLAAVLRAYEKMEFPAVIGIISALLKITIGLGLLLLGWGVIGLALTSIVVNIVVLIIHYRLFTHVLFRPHWAWDGTAARTMVVAAYPLMLNGLLINLFFKIDVFLLQPMRGDTITGYYNGAYKFIDGLLILPNVLTFALFPAFSQYAAGARDKLAAAYAGALRILTLISLPICVGTFYVAHDVIGTLLGKSFLPDSAIALQILIWFLPFSYINGVTQYVLIALNKQKVITAAFVGAFATNLFFNALFIPTYGYVAASVVTILSEVALLIPFTVIMRRAGVSIPLVPTILKPALAAALMGLVLWPVAAWSGNFILIVGTGVAVYAAALVLLRAITPDDMVLLRKALRRG